MIESTKRKPRNAEIADKPESYRRSGARDQHLTPEADMSLCFFLIAQACKASALPEPMKKTFAVAVIAERAKVAGKLLSEKAARTQKARIVPGSLFLLRFPPTHYIHVGIVSHADSASFQTCEGNTNHGGSSNGFEAIERMRGYKNTDFVIW